MNSRFFIFIASLMLLICAQNDVVEYTYDDAGNRIEKTTGNSQGQLRNFSVILGIDDLLEVVLMLPFVTLHLEVIYYEQVQNGYADSYQAKNRKHYRADKETRER